MYHRGSEENPSYAVPPSITATVASRPRSTGMALAPCSGVRSTQRRSVRRPRGLSEP